MGRESELFAFHIKDRVVAFKCRSPYYPLICCFVFIKLQSAGVVGPFCDIVSRDQFQPESAEEKLHDGHQRDFFAVDYYEAVRVSRLLVT
jgi:hypothetical protein